MSTGDRTVTGKLSKLSSAPKTKPTTLQRELNYFTWIISG